MELLEARRSTLIVIDLQGKLMESVWRGSMVLAVTRRLLRLAEMFAVPVIVTEQYPRGLGATHPEILQALDTLSVPTLRLEKTSFGCCGEPRFEELLAQARPGLRPDRRQLVVAGIEAHVCVMATVLELLREGSAVHLCWDAVSGRGELYRHYALQRMAGAGAVLTNHESVAFEWARDKNHPCFRELSALLKEGQPSP